MEISLVAFVLVLLLCLIMSGLIGSMIYYLLYRKLKSSENMSSTPATTISNIESAPVIPASQAFSSGANEQTSSTIAELENGLDTDGAPPPSSPSPRHPSEPAQQQLLTLQQQSKT